MRTYPPQSRPLESLTASSKPLRSFRRAEAVAAALPKNSNNEQAVSSAIRAFTADGTIDRLLKKWVGTAAANAETSIPLLHTTLG